MFLDRLMCGLATNTIANGCDQNLGGGKEGQIARQLTFGHGWVRTELVENRQESLQQSIDGEERIGKGHSTHDRARHIPFIPLISGQFTSHRCIAAKKDGESVHPLT